VRHRRVSEFGRKLLAAMPPNERLTVSEIMKLAGIEWDGRDRGARQAVSALRRHGFIELAGFKERANRTGGVVQAYVRKAPS
jgi:hypothetical protein